MTRLAYSWIDDRGWQSRPFSSEAEARDRAIACYRARLEARGIDLAALDWSTLERAGWRVVAHEDVLP